MNRRPLAAAIAEAFAPPPAPPPAPAVTVLRADHIPPIYSTKLFPAQPSWFGIDLGAPEGDETVLVTCAAEPPEPRVWTVTDLRAEAMRLNNERARIAFEEDVFRNFTDWCL